jgi:Domain of unknown function (DUF1902)
MQSSAKKVFGFTAQWDPESDTWWCSNDELPVATEAATFDELVARVSEIAPEIAAINGHAEVGDEIEIRVTGEKVRCVPVSAAA